METETTYLLQLLRIKVEKKMGFGLKSPNDFNKMLLKLNKVTNENISLSTIKRLWNYVNSKHTPRFATLSILSRFVGYSDWEDFCKTHAHTFLNEGGIYPLILFLLN